MGAPLTASRKRGTVEAQRTQCRDRRLERPRTLAHIAILARKMPLGRHASTSSDNGDAKTPKRRASKASSSSFGLNKLQGRVQGIKEYAVSTPQQPLNAVLAHKHAHSHMKPYARAHAKSLSPSLLLNVFFACCCHRPLMNIANPLAGIACCSRGFRRIFQAAGERVHGE